MSLITRTPNLNDLPPPPREKMGWPWTEQSQSLTVQMPNGSEWPCISIITPSYNQGQFIEETIRSVLLQGYPNLEYIIIDGGSTDNSVEIIQKYAPWLTYWISEPDQGQTDAIQKGFKLSSGVVWNWLNSDDLLELNAIAKIANAYYKNSSATTYSGKLICFNSDQPEKNYLHSQRFQKLSDLICVWEKWANPQPVTFLSSSATHKAGGLDISLRYAMDYELYLRLAQLENFQAELIDTNIARFRLHENSKTVSQQVAFKSEIAHVFDNFASQYPSLLPKNWRNSRAIFQYHLSLDIAKENFNHSISLFQFIIKSLPFLPKIWNYRFFWASIISYFKPGLKY